MLMPMPPRLTDISAIASGQRRISVPSPAAAGRSHTGRHRTPQWNRHFADIHRHRHIRFDPAEVLAAEQCQRCLVRLARMLGGADGVLAPTGDEHQPAAPG